MKLHRQEYQQLLPISLDEAWDFFSRPENLNEITPDDMQFEILTENIPRMYQGQIIQYNVTPFPMMKMGWVTEITHVEDRKMFVDEQRFGPYAFWHHQHIFEEVENGTLMTDILHYRVPLGIVGKLINALFIQRKVKGIFEYRFRVLENKFVKSVLTSAERS
ncbi:MAG: SRPBCC family protein [Flavobacteriales bacterium]|nr:SRPBCC family protein [Flavobacteriales bacterium]